MDIPALALGQAPVAAELLGVGNCGEHAAMAFCLANTLPFPPGAKIWYVDLNMHPSEDPAAPIVPFTDHAFIAIGYPDDPERIVVVDAWQMGAQACYAKDCNFPFLLMWPVLYGITPRAVEITPNGIDYLAAARGFVDTDFLANRMDTTGPAVPSEYFADIPRMYDHWWLRPS
ncbi:hypothetical protein ACIOEW_39810 [Streptomyces sp. NPDC087901]|uniref:hypothetical protein n=1 Tax=Streptomyces sp. NPDC087901 TaxID=3365818 RepID=UPI00382F9932